MFGNREAGYEYSPETVVVLRQEAIAEWWRTVWPALSLTRHVLPIGLGAFGSLAGSEQSTAPLHPIPTGTRKIEKK